jgi:CRP/FNR family transcriptional regulator, cyclic AMP receptor protein
MKSETIDLEVLKRIPIFHGFTDAECRQLADLATITEFEPADIVVHQGQTSQDLWILLQGCCEVIRQLDGKKSGGDAKKSKAEPLELAVLEPYNSFGEMSFFHPAEHSASVRAKTAVRLLCLPRRRFDALLEHHSSAACKLACNTVVGLSQRMREMNEWVADLEGRKPAGRVGAEWGELRKKVFDGWQL